MGLDSRSSTGILALGAADGRMTVCGCLLLGFSLWLAGGCAYQAQQRAKGWLLIETKHIRVRTSMDRAPAVRLAIEMQHIRDVLASYALPCAFQGNGDRFQVTALPSSQYADFAPENAAAFYRSTKISGPSDYEAQMIIPDGLGLDAKAIFQHEMTHHLLALCLRGAPRWLHEGLAKFFETTRTDSGKTTFGTPPYVFVDSAKMDIRRVLYKDQHVEVLPFYILPSIHDIIGTDSDVWMAHDLLATVAMYAAAWGLIHFLELGAPDLHPRFEAYLHSLQQFDGDPQALFVKTFEGVPLQDRLDGYLKRGDFPLLRSRSSTVVERKVNVSVREMGEDEGHLQMAWLWSGIRGKQGQERFLQHLAAAKQSSRTRATADVLGALSR